MKISSFLLLLAVICCACKKTSVTDKKSDHYSEIVSASQSEQKSIYSTLTAEEKAGVWISHFDEMSKSRSFNSLQVEILKSAQQLLLTRKETKPEEFINSDAFIIWNHRAAEAFTKNEFYALFVSLPASEKSVETLHVLPANCGCSSQSDWCNAGMSGDPGTWWACDANNCAVTTKDGCGTFWNYPCNNNCRIHSIFG